MSLKCLEVQRSVAAVSACLGLGGGGETVHQAGGTDGYGEGGGLGGEGGDGAWQRT